MNDKTKITDVEDQETLDDYVKDLIEEEENDEATEK